MYGISKPVDAFDRNGVGAMAGDLCAHGDQTFGKVTDLGFTRGIDQFGCALCQARRDQCILRGPHRHQGEDNPCACQSGRGTRLNIPVGKLDDRTKGLHRAYMEVNRPRADGTATGKRDPRLAIASKQRPKDKDGGPHLAHQIIGRIKIGDPTLHHKNIAVATYIHAMIAKKHFHRPGIGQVRDIIELQRSIAGKRRCNQWQGRILRPADGDFASQRHPAINLQTVHLFSPLMMA